MNELRLQSRRYDIDRLRIFAMLAVFLMHCTGPFHQLKWVVKNLEQTMGFSILVGYLDSWLMPLFFLLSGAGSFFALKHRSGGQYVWDRFKRLLVPLYGIGLLVIVPPQYYWHDVNHGSFSGSFWEFYPQIFTKFRVGGFFSLTLNPYHLWFLYSLFFISLVLLPVMIFFKGRRGKALTDKLAVLCAKRGGVFILIIPLFLYRLALGLAINSNFNWPEQFHYMFYFLFGYIMVTNPVFQESFKRDWWIGLTMNIVAYIACAWAVITSPALQQMIDHGKFSFGGLAFMALANTFMCWGLLIALLGLGVKYLNGNQGKVLSYGNEAVLPFYLVHQTMIVGVAFYVVQLDLPVGVKFGLLLVTAFVLSIGSYELLVRRFNVMRVIFGMKPRKRSEQS